MNRTVSVVRMQLINKQTFVWVPLIVLGASFAMSIAIYAILYSSGVPGPFYGGGSQAPLWVLLFVGISSLTLTFPFSQAMSVTRREFFLGTMLAAAMCAVLLAAVFAVGGMIEEATGGWGLNGYFFALDWVVADGPLVAAFFYFVLALLIFMLGFWSATVYKRSGAMVLTIIWSGVGVLLVVAVWAITRFEMWADVISTIVEQGPAGFATWGLLVTVLLGGISYLTLRRTVP
ncbi:hypothetical protein Q9R08_02465 [Microbacterium sp. QXD-8]|uniref:ABC transporter permease n=1 Tax=Microbacterium psychrotolerans TaxID=3068321 RepID=A0ABU0YWY8_9MICO|nr:hypothetical protein [Microbacterium sp. QXD-8]MDQ7876830.1 hypothetical protein [Microbacterium sp. QXD-8]